MTSHCLVSSLFTPPVRILRRGRHYVLGRDRRVQFPLPSEVVSRKHAEIWWTDPNHLAIRDLGSKNGTRVNDRPIDDHKLRNGDVIWIGPFQFKYRQYDGDISGLLEETTHDAETTVGMRRDTLGALAFGGRFSGNELLEICQLLGLNEKSGVLTVTGPEEAYGTLCFRRGAVIRARIGADAGEPAALALLAVPQGTFEFTESHAGKEEVSLSAEGLVMEAARRRDEGGERGEGAAGPRIGDSEDTIPPWDAAAP